MLPVARELGVCRASVASVIAATARPGTILLVRDAWARRPKPSLRDRILRAVAGGQTRKAIARKAGVPERDVAAIGAGRSSPRGQQGEWLDRALDELGFPAEPTETEQEQPAGGDE
jgi:hypothetical protein